MADPGLGCEPEHDYTGTQGVLVQGGGILSGSLSAALVVLSGALYALLFALGKLRRSSSLLHTAFVAYGLLVASVLGLGRALEIHGFWIAVVIVMLIGYLLAPIAIWQLCIGVHREVGSADLTGESERG